MAMDGSGPEGGDHHGGGDAGANAIDVQALQDLVRVFGERGVHPVLVFGTGGTGKSMMLHSMVAFAQRGGERVSVRLGDRIFPSSFHDSEDRYNEAKKFFYHQNPIFEILGEKSPQTFREYPFFIPLDVTSNDATYPFAFLEGNGEDYHKNGEIDFKEIKVEIAYLLQNFRGPISVVFVAPMVKAEAYPAEVADPAYSYQCLAEVINKYGRLRKNRGQDRALFLMSKWDGKFDPENRRENFGEPNARLVAAEVAKITHAWQAFAAIQGMAEGAKSVMPYSAAWIRDGRRQIVDDALKVYFDNYNKMLWSWLFCSPFWNLDRSKIPYSDVAAGERTNGFDPELILRVVAGAWMFGISDLV